jgi:hypothetical protein
MEKAIELMAKFQKKYPEAGNDPILKRLFKQYKSEISHEVTRCSVCGFRERSATCWRCIERKEGQQ